MKIIAEASEALAENPRALPTGQTVIADLPDASYVQITYTTVTYEGDYYATYVPMSDVWVVDRGEFAGREFSDLIVTP